MKPSTLATHNPLQPIKLPELWEESAADTNNNDGQSVVERTAVILSQSNFTSRDLSRSVSCDFLSSSSSSEYDTPASTPTRTASPVFFEAYTVATGPNLVLTASAFRTRTGSLVDDLLNNIYLKLNRYDWKERRRISSTSSSVASSSEPALTGNGKRPLREANLRAKSVDELAKLASQLELDVSRMNNALLSTLRRRDKLNSGRTVRCDIITAALQAISPKRSVDTKMRFSIEPSPGDTGFAQWADAMKMVVRLPGGIPDEFRKKLWLTLSEQHIVARKINWPRTVRNCFSDKSTPDDESLGEQIVKDLHRTGCSMFSGQDSEHNQALLKQVLLAYARWNKSVGYCQGFNMLAAIILEVVEWDVHNSLKVMIFLIEGLLPESYFANNLRGLSVDMAVFRDLLRLRLPQLSKHLDRLQYQSGDTSIASYEPPLINVFTMQWFLTLFSNCLPQKLVLRIWDLIFLEGNEVLLRTALAIWDCLADRIMSVGSADEFYSIMGVLTREMMEFGVTDTNELVKTICIMAPFPFPQLSDFREKYTYNIRPLTSSSIALVRRGLQLFHSDDEDETDEQVTVANWCLSTSYRTDGLKTPPAKGRSRLGNGSGMSTSASSTYLSASNVDAQRMSLDVSLLKKQYQKLKERQKQAQVILTEGIAAAHTTAMERGRQAGDPVRHLLQGKTALTAKRPKRPSPVLIPGTVNKRPDNNNRGLGPRTQTLMDIIPTMNKVLNGTFQQKPKSPLRRNLSASTIKASDNRGETLSWDQIRIDRKRDTFTRKMSAPAMSLSSSTESSKNRSNIANNNVIESGDESSDGEEVTSSKLTSRSRSSSTSSTSTELCDDVGDTDLTDYASSPEPSKVPKKTNGLENKDTVAKVEDLSPTSDAKSTTPSVDLIELTQGADDFTLDSISPTSTMSLSLLDNRASSASPECAALLNGFLEQACSNQGADDSGDHVQESEGTSYSESIKRELSNLSVEECLQRLNDKLSTLKCESE